jgi:hypothetical protein
VTEMISLEQAAESASEALGATVDCFRDITKGLEEWKQGLKPLEEVIAAYEEAHEGVNKACQVFETAHQGSAREEQARR